VGALLAAAGYWEVATFQKRKCVPIPLETSVANP